jgi:hypothetical protein
MELLEQYKDQLTDPIIIAKIESELIAMDKAYLAGDPSMRFYTALGGKSFGVHRKKMFLMVGGIESFSKGTGTYSFLPNSLAQGWDPNTMPIICNELRKGSHDRGHETQLGGAQTKSILKIFQDTYISEEDCGTKLGINIDTGVISLSEFYGHYLAEDGHQITKADTERLKGKIITVRSPQTCQTKDGYCKTCCGERFRRLHIKMLSVLGIDVSSTFTTMALKNMHGTQLSLIQITDLDQFII